MAGSYKHVVNEKGQLYSSENWLIDNLGDAYETIEEMYGMIWELADQITGWGTNKPEDISDVVERARQTYKDGIAASPGLET